MINLLSTGLRETDEITLANKRTLNHKVWLMEVLLRTDFIIHVFLISCIKLDIKTRDKEQKLAIKYPWTGPVAFLWLAGLPWH